MALLRPSRPDAEASKALHRKIRKYGAALLARQYGLGGLAALGSAAACEVLRIPLANGLALGILAGTAGAILLALLAFETAIQTAIRIGADAEVEQMARARRGSTSPVPRRSAHGFSPSASCSSSAPTSSRGGRSPTCSASPSASDSSAWSRR